MDVYHTLVSAIMVSRLAMHDFGRKMRDVARRMSLVSFGVRIMAADLEMKQKANERDRACPMRR